jgi:2-oxoglutarate ferredoxin oxidoreductase subunit alpha
VSGAVLTGEHFLEGDAACAEGALAAGCRFYAGYPITPSSEIAERMAVRLPQVAGNYIQMEDELASLAAVLGASWTGVRAMTATSGPGFSLMQENIGLAFMTETPCVVVNVQRGGPSTGLPTLTSQSDMMQARWGSHGDYEIIAYCPQSPQEMFDLTVRAFNAAESYRTPVLVMADEIVGHMSERVRIPSDDAIERVDRNRPDGPAGDGRDMPAVDGVPPMYCAGDGHSVHITSLTHDERGYPAINADAQRNLVERLMDKIRKARRDIVEYECVNLDDAAVVLVAYGSTARSALRAMRQARERGIRVGLLRLITVWPFPGEAIAALDAGAIIVPEGNQGQIVREVERFARCPVTGVTHAGGNLMPPRDILSAIEEAAGYG